MSNKLKKENEEQVKKSGIPIGHIVIFAIAIIIPLVVGFVSSRLSGDPGDLYDTLFMPPLSVPGFVFPIVWTVMYVLMGVASGMIAVSAQGPKFLALLLYAIHLVLNFFWCIIFFYFEQRWIALSDLLIMWILVMIIILLCKKINRLSLILFSVYLAWLTYAAYLNIGAAILNNNIEMIEI